MSDQITTRPLSVLRANPLNPRGPVTPESVADLAESIRAQGVLQPLLVTPDGTIVAGHRRHAAAQLAGLAEVPVLVRAMDEADQLQAMLAENIARQALTPLGEARAYRELTGRGVKVAEITRRVGVGTGTIRDRLALFRLAPAVQALYDRPDAPPGSLLQVLLGIADPARQLEIAALAAEGGLTVPQIRDLLERGQRTHAGGGGGGGGASTRAATTTDARTAVFNALLKRANEQVAFGTLAMAMEAVCCACNAHRANPGECPACPLCAAIGMALNPRLLRRAGEGVRRVA